MVKDMCGVLTSPTHTTLFSMIQISNFLNLVNRDLLEWVDQRFSVVELKALFSFVFDLCFYVFFYTIYVPFHMMQIASIRLIQAALLFLDKSVISTLSWHSAESF